MIINRRRRRRRSQSASSSSLTDVFGSRGEQPPARRFLFCRFGRVYCEASARRAADRGGLHRVFESNQDAKKDVLVFFPFRFANNSATKTRPPEIRPRM